MGIFIQHHYLVPPPVHPLTYQVRPFTVLLLHGGTYKLKEDFKKTQEKGWGKVTFLCMQKCEITLIFFLFDGRFKKKTGAVGMKVNNMHEFVKKNKTMLLSFG